MLRNVVLAASILVSSSAFATTAFNGTNLSVKSPPKTANSAITSSVPEQETNYMIGAGVAIMGLIAFRRQRNS